MAAFFIFIKHNVPFIWNIVEWLNCILFKCRYPQLYKIAEDILKTTTLSNFSCSCVDFNDLNDLSRFLEHQSKEYVKYFNPHKFDYSTLRRLCKDHSFLMMKVVNETDGNICGYFFLRCFFTGRAFHGLIVDSSVRGLGIGTSLWLTSMRICNAAHLRMFATISIHNNASLYSCKKANDVIEEKKLSEDYILMEFKLKDKNVETDI